MCNKIRERLFAFLDKNLDVAEVRNSFFKNSINFFAAKKVSNCIHWNTLVTLFKKRKENLVSNNLLKYKNWCILFIRKIFSMFLASIIAKMDEIDATPLVGYVRKTFNH